MCDFDALCGKSRVRLDFRDNSEKIPRRFGGQDQGLFLVYPGTWQLNNIEEAGATPEQCVSPPHPTLSGQDTNTKHAEPYSYTRIPGRKILGMK